MPTFADIFDTAEGIAIDEQAYEVAALISADEHRRTALERAMHPRDLRRYDAIMFRAATNLSLKESTKGRIHLD